MKTILLPQLSRKLFASLFAANFLVLLAVSASAQTAPTAQILPYAQNFGTTTFTALPAGVAAWNGLSGSTINSQATAEASTPTGNATLAAATAAQTGGGTFGYAAGGNAQLYIQTSSNASNGANQAAIAVDTTGKQNIVLTYEISVISAQPRTVGVVAQYRVGISGSWTTLAASSGLNPFSQAGGTTGLKTTVSATLPAAADNQPVVQVRWAVWRGTETGNSSGIGLDNISITGDPASTSPSISSFSPSSGFVGGIVTINGFNFGAAPAVRFNGIAASASVNPAGTQITATVPGGATTGKITVEVAGQDTATSATDFTVLAPDTPIISLSTNTISSLSTAVGVASAATNYLVTGTNLGSTPVTVTPDSALLEIGTNGTDFTNNLSLAPVGGVVSNSIFLRVAATNVVTNYSAAISHVSGSASNSLAVSGAITNLPPTLTVNPTNLSTFAPVAVNTPSDPQVLTVSGSNLTNDVAVTAPAGFEVAFDGVTWGASTSLPLTGGGVSALVSVRFAASSVFGPRSGSVTLASSGITNRVPVAGSVVVPNVPGQVYWNFDTATPTSGTGGDYATWTFPAITQNNNNGTTTLLTTTSASSGYTNPFNVLASGTTNAGAAARVGGFNASTNAFFEVQIVVPTSTTTSITNISFGSRSTGTGPAAYSIRSSVDGFASDVVTNALTTNSAWGMYEAPVSIALSNGTNTIRIYGYGSAAASSTAGTANWRIDDLTLALGTGSGPTPPSGLSYTPSTVSGVVGTAITNMVPTVTGTVTNYSVSPTLPTGISIDPTTGVISGTPTAVASSASYTVTASNAGGSTTANVTIVVISAYDAWATSYSLSGANALPTADPDSDGLNNNSEFAFGTNPTVANATTISVSAITTGNTTVTWIERNSGFTYAVQSTTNLNTTAFANDGSVTPTTSGDQSGVPSGYTRKQFTLAASNNKFFRVRATPN